MFDWMKERLMLQKEADVGEISRDRYIWGNKEPP